MCYVVPLAAAAVTTLRWRKDRSQQSWWLSLMFYGGGLFGVVDHLWNGELFLISRDWLKDLALGVVITAVIFLAWKIIMAMAKSNLSLSSYLAANTQGK